MADYARSHVVTRTESVIMAKIRTSCSAGAVNPDGSGVVDADGSVHCEANHFGGNGWAFAPGGIGHLQVGYDRTRAGIALCGQNERPPGDVQIGRASCSAEVSL